MLLAPLTPLHQLHTLNARLQYQGLYIAGFEGKLPGRGHSNLCRTCLNRHAQ